MGRITVLLADDDALFRKGLAMLLAHHQDIQVVGEAGDARQALHLAETLQPDILLLDVMMPDNKGFEILPMVRERSPRTKAVMYSGWSDDSLVRGALERGARGYLLKTADHQELLKAIRVVHAGDIWAGRKIIAQVVEWLVQKAAESAGPRSRPGLVLTRREQEVVRWVAHGLTNKEVARKLGVSDKTVKTHLGNIYSKLNVNRRSQLRH
jgi:DNA-binding NarL/FixJ family response regulator